MNKAEAWTLRIAIVMSLCVGYYIGWLVWGAS